MDHAPPPDLFQGRVHQAPGFAEQRSVRGRVPLCPDQPGRQHQLSGGRRGPLRRAHAADASRRATGHLDHPQARVWSCPGRLGDRPGLRRSWSPSRPEAVRRLGITFPNSVGLRRRELHPIPGSESICPQPGGEGLLGEQGHSVASGGVDGPHEVLRRSVSRRDPRRTSRLGMATHSGQSQAVAKSAAGDCQHLRAQLLSVP